MWSVLLFSPDRTILVPIYPPVYHLPISIIYVASICLSVYIYLSSIYRLVFIYHDSSHWQLSSFFQHIHKSLLSNKLTTGAPLLPQIAFSSLFPFQLWNSYRPWQMLCPLSGAKALGDLLGSEKGVRSVCSRAARARDQLPSDRPPARDQVVSFDQFPKDWLAGEITVTKNSGYRWNGGFLSCCTPQ